MVFRMANTCHAVTHSQGVMGDGIVHDGVVAQDDTQMSALWQLREGVGPACGQVTPARNVAITLFRLVQFSHNSSLTESLHGL